MVGGWLNLTRMDASRTISNTTSQSLTSSVKSVLVFVCFMVLITGLLLYKAIFIASMSFSVSFWTFYGIIATTFLLSRIPYAYLHKDDHTAIYPDSAYPNVSVIIAAKNEEDGIFRTIATCVGSQYPGEIECIVIDDGSTDGTKKEVLRAEQYYGGKVRLISFPVNRGKREAMAVGMNEARHDIIVFVDSDKATFAPDAIHHLIEHFMANERVRTVSRNTKAENTNANLLTHMYNPWIHSLDFNLYKASESVHQFRYLYQAASLRTGRTGVLPLVWERGKDRDSWARRETVIQVITRALRSLGPKGLGTGCFACEGLEGRRRSCPRDSSVS